MANFALIGAAGYIAPRHLKAIKDKREQEKNKVDISDDDDDVDDDYDEDDEDMYESGEDYQSILTCPISLVAVKY